ncbi:hypothetical protein HY772_08685 [Candidatus Woesearchaeota archaeon]|nr:hypothetical protein [Candidatus Woesearchaeota archaeon]
METNADLKRTNALFLALVQAAEKFASEQPQGDRVTLIDVQNLIMHWMSPGREYDDNVFVEQLLKPQRAKYGDRIIALEQLEARTGRRHERHRRDSRQHYEDSGLVNGRSYLYHRIVCKVTQATVGPVVAAFGWLGLVFEFDPGPFQISVMSVAERLL